MELTWKRSSFCDSGTCFESRRVGDRVEVRDSKDPDGPVLTFSEREWTELIAVAKAGEFDFEEVSA